MTETIHQVLPRFTQQRALVVGDLMLDRYWSGPSRRLCQEAPVPIVDLKSRREMPGGAGNSAVNLARLGAKTQIIGLVGGDTEGDTLRRLLCDEGIDCSLAMEIDGRQTLAKTRVLCDRHLLARIDDGTISPLDTASEERLIRELLQAYVVADVVIVSDYGYGTITPAVRDCLANLQAKQPKVLAIDSKQLGQYRGIGATLCKPNYAQALQLLNWRAGVDDHKRAERLAKMGPRILNATGARIAAVTLDREGALLFERDAEPLRTFARSVSPHRTAGAGDTYLATFALALAAGASTSDAADLAASAAAVVVGKEETAACSREELRQHLECERVCDDVASLAPTLEQYRRAGQQIVLTNGCFDLLHRGHITYLERAKQLGDVLIVGLNTDDSIRRLKGESRPINCLADRVRVLSALSCVDHVVSFAEDTPHALIEAIRPDVFVKGGDYTLETLPEADLVRWLGGVVKILPFVNDRSTTRIISRIRETSNTTLISE